MKNDKKKKKTLKVNNEIILAESRFIERKMWENNRFCECGADRLRDCECDKDKRERWVKRMNRKREKELGEKALKLLIATENMKTLSH